MAIQAVCEGIDVFVWLPTGFGKKSLFPGHFVRHGPQARPSWVSVDTRRFFFLETLGYEANLGFAGHKCLLPPLSISQ